VLAAVHTPAAASVSESKKLKDMSPMYAAQGHRKLQVSDLLDATRICDAAGIAGARLELPAQ